MSAFSLEKLKSKYKEIALLNVGEVCSFTYAKRINVLETIRDWQERGFANEYKTHREGDSLKVIRVK